jgi:hypothetical protein
LLLLLRVQMFFTRPRMTITTYAFDNGETNELYAGTEASVYIYNSGST